MTYQMHCKCVVYAFNHFPIVYAKDLERFKMGFKENVA